MPKKAKELSALQVRRIKKPGLHAVGGVAGLQVYIKQSGAKSWVFRVKVGDRRRDFGLGGFPDITLSNARDKAREIRKQIEAGIDPIAAKKALLDELRVADAKRMTFKQASVRCHSARSAEFKSKRHSDNWIRSLEMYAYPTLGPLPVSQIEVSHVQGVLQPIWAEKTETAKRVRQRIEAVLSWSTVSGYREGENPARWKDNLSFTLPNPSKIKTVKHHAALPWSEIASFMVDLKKREGMGARALEFAILTAARSGEVRFAEWNEIDLESKTWLISAERMKANRGHAVPLSNQALTLLKSLPVTLDSPCVFPAARGGPLSDMALSAVTKRMEVNAVPHGFRSTFKDWCRANTNYADEISELALAHVNSDATRAAYARDDLLEIRKQLLDDWSAYCSKEGRS